MTASNSFSKLFRTSMFARYDPSIKRVYQASAIPPPSNPTANPLGPPSSRPAHFGFKRDMPPYFFGKPLTSIILENQDGDFGQAHIQDGGPARQTFRIVKELKKAMEENRRVPVRVLNKARGDSLCVGIAGIVGCLDIADIPDNFRFSSSDFTCRKAYWAYVKRAEINAEGTPIVQVSLKQPIFINRTKI